MLGPLLLTIAMDFVFCRTWSTSPSRPWVVVTLDGLSETRNTLSVCTMVSRILRFQSRSRRPIPKHNNNSPVNRNSRNRLPKPKALPGVESKPSPRSVPLVAGLCLSLCDFQLYSVLQSKYPFCLIQLVKPGSQMSVWTSVCGAGHHAACISPYHKKREPVSCTNWERIRKTKRRKHSTL